MKQLNLRIMLAVILLSLGITGSVWAAVAPESHFIQKRRSG